MTTHLKLHPFTGSTDHDFTGLLSGHLLEFNGTNIASAGVFPTSGDLWSASTGTNSIIANNGTGNVASGNFSVIAGGTGLTNSFDNTLMTENARLAENGGVIYSAGTDLYDIFAAVEIVLTGSGTDNTIPMWNGTSALEDSILTQQGLSGMTISGDVSITGNLEVIGTATTINTQDLYVADNTITLNSGGTSISATGGGIFVEDGVIEGVDASWLIDANGNWETLNGISSSAATINNGNLNVTGGGIIQSGGTDLYSIFAITGSGDITRVQGGTNISTGGTANVPIINLDTDIVLTSVQATALSGDTIFSGGTDVSDLFLTSEDELWSAGTGIYSIVSKEGNNNASGVLSIAQGTGTTASGNYSYAIGRDTIASGIYSHVEGWATQSIGSSSHAEGYLSISFGSQSHAEGRSTEANGTYSHAEGRLSIADGENAHAEGYNTDAIGDYSHTEAYQTFANGIGAHAEGYLTRAEGDYSHAQGYYARAFGDYSHAGGKGVGGSNRITSDGISSFANFTKTISNGNTGALSDYSTVLGGRDHNIEAGAEDSSILGGSGNTIMSTASGSTIIGGQNITATTTYTTYVPNLNIDSNLANNNALTQLLVRDTDGSVKYRDAASLLSTGATNTFVTGGTYDNNTGIATYGNNAAGTFNVTGFSTGTTDTYVQGGTNISTGGTTNEPIINLDADITLTSIQAITLSGDTIYSGGTDLSDIFAITGSGDITRVQGGTNISTGGTANTPIINLDANIVLTSVQSTTLSGDTIYSGGTDIYDIFQSASNPWRVSTGSGSAKLSGSTSIASGLYSVAEGQDVIASGSSSHAEGSDTIAGGSNSHSQGYGTIAAGFGSHAGGYSQIGSHRIIASGASSFAHFRKTSSDGFKGSLADYSAILGGLNQHIEKDADGSAIIGGNTNLVLSAASYSVIAGGTNITATTANTTYVPSLNIDSVLSQDDALTEILVRATDGTVKYRDVTTIGGGGGITGSGTDNVIPMWSGTSALEDSILSQQGSSGITVTGDITITGDLEVIGTATTISTQDLYVQDNTITLNSGGTAASATGGGIFVEDGVSGGTDAEWIIDANGNWASNSGIQGTTVTATEFFAMSPYTDSSPASPSDDDAWFHSGATGTITLNYRIGGATFFVELG